MERPDGALFEADGRPLVAMVRAPLFNASETFVQSQAAGLERYQPLVVGLEGKGNVPEALAGRLMLANGARERLMVRLGHWGRLGARVAEAKPALIHAQFGTDGVMALPLARRLGVPLVTTLRGHEVHRRGLLRSGRLSWMRYALGRKRLLREGELFLTVSAALMERALAQGFPAERTLVHHNGVDLARFSAAREDDGATILHVGRLVEKKGTALLIRALAQIPAGTLEIVGEGPLRPSLERLAGELGLSARVRFLGRLSPEAVAGRMAGAALLAAPSLAARDGDSEGLPNVVVEAAAAGLPVVGSDHEGIPEAILDGRTGYLVSEGEVEPLAARIGELLDDRTLRAVMGAAGRKLAGERFDLRRQMQLLEQRYDEVTSTSTIETR